LRLLLDTVTFLWLAEGSRSLSPRALDLFKAADTVAYLSVVSAWEIGVKHANGRLVLGKPPAELIPEQRAALALESLPLTEEAVLMLGKLPRIHADPFDRMLACQALTEGLVLLTPDAALRKYPIRCEW